MTADPALSFWLRAAAAEGALHEEDGGATVVLLPTTLQDAFRLPEQVTLTADPEVSREAGAQLLAPGHPVLAAAVDRVLDRGDVGRVPLAWPAGPAPAPAALLERLRDRVHVDHGRIDLADRFPHPAYTPLLRVAALVTYHVSFDDRFQERQEVWLDAASALPLPTDLVPVLASAVPAETPDHPVLPADLLVAACAAEGELQVRAGQRLQALAGDSRGARDAELTRVDQYYLAAGAALERRLAGAPADRQSPLRSRIAATAAERERRLAEVEEKYRGSLSLQFYRLHELLAPTIAVPVIIRRGAREYPFTFRWLLALHAVAPVRCPHCGQPAPLVAGKQRLGCAECLRTPVAPASGAGAAQVRPAADEPPGRPDAAGPAPTPVASVPLQAGPASARPVDAERAGTDGNRLAERFWGDVLGEDGRVARLVVPGSPAEVAVALWGPSGPATAVGVAPAWPPHELNASTRVERGAPLQVTSGVLRSGVFVYPYALRWAGTQGRPGAVRVAEVVPGRARPGARLSGLVDRWWSRPWPARQVPAPRLQLEGVAGALWHVELPARGPVLLLRALAAWWGVKDRVATEPAAVAAALARLVAEWSGVSVTIALVAGQYGADEAEVRALGPVLRRLLPEGPARGW